MAFASLLPNYARIRGKTEWWERYSLLSERNPDLTLKKAENLSYGELMILNRKST
jgi:hypothetical protein